MVESSVVVMVGMMAQLMVVVKVGSWAVYWEQLMAEKKVPWWVDSKVEMKVAGLVAALVA